MSVDFCRVENCPGIAHEDSFETSTHTIQLALSLQILDHPIPITLG